ncbi:hypothetical protein YC2023_124240 [Brassica napus]
MRVESIKSRKKGEEPFDNAGNMNSPSGTNQSVLSSTRVPEKRILRASEIDRDGGGVGEEGRDGGGGEATEMAVIPVVEVSKSNRIGREREMRERQRHRVMVTPVTKRRTFQALRKRQLLGLCVLLIILKLGLGVRVGLRVSDNAALIWLIDFDIKFGVSAARRTDLATDYVLCPKILCMSFGQKLIEFIRKKKKRETLIGGFENKDIDTLRIKEKF